MNGQAVPQLRQPRTLAAMARGRLAAIEEEAGPIAGPAPYHSRLGGFEGGKPVFLVCSARGSPALPIGLDVVSAQFCAVAATRRAGVSPIASLITL